MGSTPRACQFSSAQAASGAYSRPRLRQRPIRPPRGHHPEPSALLYRARPKPPPPQRGGPPGSRRFSGSRSQSAGFVDPSLICERRSSGRSRFPASHTPPSHAAESSSTRSLVASCQADCWPCPTGNLEPKPRFLRRALSWSKADTLLSGAIDPTDLEKGDFLLPWGEESSTSVPARYCHHVDPAEAERLIVGLPYSVLEVFSGDGRENRLNLYYLLRRRD